MREVTGFKSKRTRISPTVSRVQRPRQEASEGQTLFAIKHGDRFYSWCYTSREVAEAVSAKVLCDYNPSNWVVDTDRTMLSGITDPNFVWGQA